MRLIYIPVGEERDVLHGFKLPAEYLTIVLGKSDLIACVLIYKFLKKLKLIIILSFHACFFIVNLPLIYDKK